MPHPKSEANKPLFLFSPKNSQIFREVVFDLGQDPGWIIWAHPNQGGLLRRGDLVGIIDDHGKSLGRVDRILPNFLSMGALSGCMQIEVDAALSPF